MSAATVHVHARVLSTSCRCVHPSGNAENKTPQPGATPEPRAADDNGGPGGKGEGEGTAGASDKEGDDDDTSADVGRAQAEDSAGQDGTAGISDSRTDRCEGRVVGTWGGRRHMSSDACAGGTQGVSSVLGTGMPERAGLRRTTCYGDGSGTVQGDK